MSWATGQFERPGYMDGGQAVRHEGGLAEGKGRGRRPPAVSCALTPLSGRHRKLSVNKAAT